MQHGRAELADELAPVEDREIPAGASQHSLLDDAEALFDDAKTYFQAEVAFQKSRTGYVANRLKWAAVYGAMAFGFLHLALIAFVVGIVIALSPLIGPWLATAVVVLALLAAGFVLAMKLRGKIGDIRSAFEDSPS